MYAKLKELCSAYQESLTISQGSSILREIEALVVLFYSEQKDVLTALKDINEDVYEDFIHFRGKNPERYGGKYRTPSSNGHWTGEKGDSLWIPDDTYSPPNRSYSNVLTKSWEQIKDQYRIESVQFHKGLPDFSVITYDSVSFDWLQELGVSEFLKLIGKKKEHKHLHEKAFELLAQKRNCTVPEIKDIKEKKGKNMAWHEDIDCKTLHLVYQEIHGNVSHTGGVALASIIARSKARIHRI